ncbi:hypothetical protein DFH29DRAFT_1008678 [Suillus ampliporus]|nr:hypothetical protein DFH29DRAFT_1008678 [Suillus ampliporus]
MPGARGAPCKGKSAIPKPVRGSGLNHSGLPIADQLHLEAEQPQMPEFDFNPYGGSGSVGWQAEGLGLSSNDYPPTQVELLYREPKYNFFDHFWDTPLDPNLSFENFADPQDFNAPLPQWTEDAQASDLALIRQGEIPASEVIHTSGPARTTMIRAVQWTVLPTTPYSTSRTPTVSAAGQV